MIKRLGVPKEVKQDEGRVALIPKHLTQFTGLADIFVESGAGQGSGFSDMTMNLRVQKYWDLLKSYMNLPK